MHGVLARDHVHMFLSIPPQCHAGHQGAVIAAYPDGEFPELHKHYPGRRFWSRGYFSPKSGNVTEDIILQYRELHSAK
ncbi:MAG: transposase [Paracoccaceae bacterium]